MRASISNALPCALRRCVPFLPELRILRKQQRLDDPRVAPFVWIAQRVDKCGNRRHFRIAQRRLHPALVLFVAEFIFHTILKAQVGELGNPTCTKIVMQDAAVIIEIAV